MLDQSRQAIDGSAGVIALGLSGIKGMCGSTAFGLGAVLQRQAQGWQVGQGVGVRVEGCFGGFCRHCGGQLGLRRGGLQHGRHRLGLGLDQLPAGLAPGDLPGHQAGVRQPGIGLGGIVIWQFVAVIGNHCLAARVFLAANSRFRLVLGPGLGNLVIVRQASSGLRART